MGQIREDFILNDQFSSAFSRFLTQGDAAVAKMGSIDQSLHQMESTMTHSIGQAADALIGNMRQIGETANQISSSGFDRLEAQLLRIAENTSRIGEEQERNNDKIKQADANANQLLSTLKKAVSVAAAFKIGKDLISLSDTLSQTKTRLNAVNDGLNTAAELQDMIYQSAQRTRTPYLQTADAVAKLGQSAKSVFSNNQETIQFAENLNKEFKLAGASQQEMASATQQIAQAMGKGVLKSQDFNAMLNSAPNLLQTIADYMGKDIDQLQKMAEKGQITAKIVKNAMLAATDEIDAKFSELPVTWGEAAEQMKNAFVSKMDGVLAKINDFVNSDLGQQAVSGVIAAFELLADIAGGVIDMLVMGANWVSDHWDYVYPVLIGIAAAFAAAGIAGLVSGLQAAAGWITAMAPFILIGAAIAALVYILKKAGVTFEEMGAVAGGVLGGLYVTGYTVVSFLWNTFASFAEFFANVFNDPVAAIAHLFHDLLDNILQIVETAASAIDALLGTDMSGAVSGFRNKISDWVDETVGENKIKIERMESIDVGDTISNWSKKGGEFGAKLDDFNFNMDGLGLGGSGFDTSGVPSVGDIGNVGKVGSVGKIEEDVSLADEDLKMLRDMSERQYVSLVNLTVPQTNVAVNQTVQGGGASDLDAIGDYLKNLLLTQKAAHVN